MIEAVNEQNEGKELNSDDAEDEEGGDAGHRLAVR
jgi:hypothetical protein